MKSKHLILFLLFYGILNNAAAQYFFKRYSNGKGNDVAFSAGSNNFYIVGEGPAYQNTASLLKTDSIGGLLWAKTYTDSSNLNSFRFISILPDQGNGFYILGRNNGIALMHVDSSGNIFWSKRYFMTTSTRPAYFMQTSDGNLLITAADSLKMILLKVDTSGNMIWTKNYYGNYNCSPYNGKVLELPDHSIVFCGQVGDFPSMWSMNPLNVALVVKTDSIGNLIWSKKIFWNVPPFTLIDVYTIGIELFYTSQNEYILSYYLGQVGWYAGGDSRIARLDNNGNLLWASQGITQSQFFPVSEYPVGTINFCDLGGLTADVVFPIHARIVQTDLNLVPFNSNRLWPPDHQFITNFIFQKCHQLPDHRFVFSGESHVMSAYGKQGNSLLVTDSSGFESCTAQPIAYGFAQDTMMASAPITLNIDTGGVQDQSFNISAVNVQFDECNCDSFPTAYFVFTISGDTVFFHDSSSNATSLYWVYGDNTWDTAYNANPIHIYLDSLNHIVNLYASNHCGTSLYSYTINTSTGIASVDKEFSVRIYPDPADEIVNIDFEKWKGEKEISIADVTGKVLFQKTIESGNDIKKLNIDVSQFTGGVYLVQFKNKEKIFSHKLVIK